ncbi:MAG: hypothetical protein AAGA25_00910 [Planctomycetota bacterium]
MSVSFVALLIVLLFVGIVLTGLALMIVAAAKSKNSTGLWIAVAVVATVVLIVPVGVIYLNTARVAVHHNAAASQLQTQAARQHSTFVEKPIAVPLPTAPKPVLSVVPADAMTAPSEWRPASEIMPDAEVDFYPSQREAEQALAAAIVEAYGPWGRTKPGLSQPQPLDLIHAMDGPPTNAFQSAADAVRELGVATHAVKPSISNHTRQHGILLTLTPPSPESPIGVYHARDEHFSDPVPFTFTARFVDKPWLTDLSAYRIVQESPKLIVGFSPNPESTAEDAEIAALRAVAAQLAPRVADQRGGPPKVYDVSIMYPELDSIVRNLRRLDLVQDQFTQQLERSYGTVFRHAVLVDATPDTLKRLYNGGNLTWVDVPPQQQFANGPSGREIEVAADMPVAVTASVQEYRGPLPTILSSGVLRILGLGVLVGVTLLIYRVLDNWTLGYRQGALSVTAIAIILGGALLLGLLWMA